jgi:hypothetical protein
MNPMDPENENEYSTKAQNKFFNRSSSDHWLCFTNMYDCFFTRMPAVTIIMTILAFVVFWNVALCWLTLPPTTSGVPVPWGAEIFIKSILGLLITLVSFLIKSIHTEFTVKDFVQGTKTAVMFILRDLWVHIWKEIKDFPDTCRNCLKCKGE